MRTRGGELKAVLALALGAALAVATVGSWFFTAERAKRRRIRNVRLSSIASVKDGQLVRIAGTVLPQHDLLTTPVSERTCVAYEARLTEDTRRKHQRYMIWFEAHDAIEHVIEDATGRARIVPGSAPELLIVRDVHVRNSAFSGAPRELEAFIARQIVDAERLRGKVLHYREGAIEIGEWSASRAGRSIPTHAKGPVIATCGAGS